MERLTTNAPQSDRQPAEPVAPTSAHPLTQIQRALGNRAFGQAIQAKLTISRPGDEYEQEADRVADQVMRMPDDSTPAAVRSDGPPHISGLQRKCAQCEEEEIQRQPMNGTMDEEEEESSLQAKEVPGHSSQVTPAVQAQIDGLRGGGEPLPESARAFFEPRFGRDFSQVRVHTDGRAAESARSVNALAFTIGRNVVFGAGRYAPNTDEGRNLLAHELTHVVQQTPSLSHKNATIQRLPEEAGSTATPSRTLIAEDSVEELAPGQMKKSEFLAELQTAVCQAAEEALAGTGRSTEGCPYLDFWFRYYSGQDSQHIERAIHKYAPDASSVTTASEYIPFIVAHARRSVELWVRTGELTGAPEGVPSAMPEAASAAGAENGNVLFKGREGGARVADDPQAIQSQLGSGQSLDGGVRSRMESAFGESFSSVQVHTDANAAGISSNLNARAFTVGEHVAFGSSEYRPGTVVGDALIAHELAHVVQQREASELAPAQTKGGDQGDDLLEDAADLSAMGAVVSLWSRGKTVLADIAQNAIPRLRSGLRLQRCGSEESGFEQLSEERKKKVEDYLYRGLLDQGEQVDMLPPPVKMTWAGDTFEFTFSRKEGSYQGNPGQFNMQIKFTGTHNRKVPQAHDDTEESRAIPLPREGVLNVLVEEEGADKLTIWPYGKDPSGVKFEFSHEGPNFADNNTFRGRIHHFILRSRTGQGYISGPFWISDKNAKASDYPPEPGLFYRDKEEGKGLPSTVYLVDKGNEIRFDGNGDYYKELVLREQASPIGSDYEFSFSVFHIPSDKSGTAPKTFGFTIPQSKIKSTLFMKILQTTDGGSDTIFGMGDWDQPTVKLMISPPVIRSGNHVYAWKTNMGHSGELAFPVEGGYTPPESNVELVGAPKSVTRIWAQDVKLGPWRDLFRVTAQIDNEKSTEASVNVRGIGGSGFVGSGGIKVPLTGVNGNNPFVPKVTQGTGMGLKLQLDKDGKVDLSLYDQVTRKANFMGYEHTRDHMVRISGNTLSGDYFYQFSIEFNDFKSGNLSSTGSNLISDQGKQFAMASGTASLEALATDMSFLAQIAKYERELMLIRRKAHEEGLIKQSLYDAYLKLNGAILMYQVETNAENKKNLLSAIDGFSSAFSNADAMHVALLAVAVQTGDAIKVNYYYFNILKPFDQEIIGKLAASDKQVTRDLGTKAEFLLDVTDKMNDIRLYKPVRIPATFMIKELYNAGKENYGHGLELYAFKKDGRLHVKNLTNRKEINHVETSIPSGKENASIASLVAETGIISQFNHPDFFPEGLLYFRVPGYSSAVVSTKGGMKASDYAKMIGGAIAVIGLVLVAIASFGTLAPEAAAGVAAVGAWFMFAGDMVVLGASIYDVMADYYEKGHFDTKRVLINTFDAATAILSAGSVTLGRVAIQGARVAKTGAEISNLAKFAGRWYVPVQLAQGAAGVMGVILVADSAIKQIKALSKMEEGEGKTQAAISLFWHLLSIGAIAVLGMAGSKRLMPNRTDLLILGYAAAKGSAIPVAYLGGIARFTRAHIGEFTDEAAAVKFIENSLTPEAKAWFAARYPDIDDATKLKHFEGIEGAWERHGVDINGAMTLAGSKHNWRAQNIPFVTDEILAARYHRMGHQPFVNWSSARVQMAVDAIPDGDATRLMGMIENAGFGFEKALTAADVQALKKVDAEMARAYLVDTSGNLAGNLQALAPEFAILKAAFGDDVLKALKAKLSYHYVRGKVELGRQAVIHPPGTVPVGADTQRKLIGAHSPDVLTNPDFEVKPQTGPATNPVVPNSDKTFSVKVRKKLHAGPPPVWSGWKDSTIAPSSWTNADMEAATMYVYANGVPSGSGSHIELNGIYKGIKWRVVTEDGLITASFPTGP